MMTNNLDRYLNVISILKKLVSINELEFTGSRRLYDSEKDIVINLHKRNLHSILLCRFLTIIPNVDEEPQYALNAIISNFTIDVLSDLIILDNDVIPLSEIINCETEEDIISFILENDRLPEELLSFPNFDDISELLNDFVVKIKCQE